MIRRNSATQIEVDRSYTWPIRGSVTRAWVKSTFCSIFALPFALWVVLGCNSAEANIGVPVSVKSGLCARSNSPSVSSTGTIFHQSQDRLIVVTVASAIPVEFGESTCTAVTLPNQMVVRGNLLAYEPEAGIAAVEIKLSEIEPESRYFHVGSRDLGQYANTPYNAFIGKFANHHGIATEPYRFAMENSDRHFIPKVSTVTEIHGERLNSTFRGAPVFSRNGAFVGVISDQHLPIRVGQAGLAERWLDGQFAQHLLVLPSDYVQAWLYPWIYGGRVETTGMLIDQGKLSKGEITWKNTEFEIFEDKALKPWSFGFGEILGLSGINQSTDPPGIGGSVLISSAPIRVKFSGKGKLASSDRTATGPKAKLSVKLGKLANESAKGAKILAFVRAGTEGHWDVRPLSSVDAFMTALANPNAFVIPVHLGESQTSDAARLEKLTDQVYEELEDQFATDQALHLLRQLKFLSYFARSPDYSLWTNQDFERLLNRDLFPGAQWRTIEAYAPDLATELRDSVLKIRSKRGG